MIIKSHNGNIMTAF